MFKRYTKTKKGGVKKVAKVSRTNSFLDQAKWSKLQKSFNEGTLDGRLVNFFLYTEAMALTNTFLTSTLFSPIVTITVGRDGRVFAAHEDILSSSPFFAAVFKGSGFVAAEKKNISLLDEEPEIFSCVLEYLYVRRIIFLVETLKLIVPIERRLLSPLN